MIFTLKMQILNDRSYYTTRGGGSSQCSSIYANWVPSDLPQNELNSWDTIASKLPNGSIEWAYAWDRTSSGSADTYALMALSYGVI